jgi:hypothetical protein
MQIRGCCPYIPQGRNIDTRKGSAQALAAVGSDGADILRIVVPAVRERGTAMATAAILGNEQ